MLDSLQDSMEQWYSLHLPPAMLNSDAKLLRERELLFTIKLGDDTQAFQREGIIVYERTSHSPNTEA